MKKFYHRIKKPGLIAALLLASAVTLQSQTTMSVTVSSNQFSPSDISINVGDQVTWTNVGGSHNVNGTQDAYPDNPESFGNSVGSGWVFSHTFTTPGFYNYHCDPHQFLGMTGTITVNGTTGIFDNKADAVKLRAYPNPTTDILYFEFKEKRNENSILEIEIYTIEGKLIKDAISEQKKVSSISVDDIDKGYYLLRVTTDDKMYQANFIKR